MTYTVELHCVDKDDAEKYDRILMTNQYESAQGVCKSLIEKVFASLISAATVRWFYTKNKEVIVEFVKK